MIQQGGIGTNLYISNTGTFEILKDAITVLEFMGDRVFGELALLYSEKRTATVRAIDNGSVWVLDAPAFKKLTIKSALEEQEEMVSFLMNVSTLNTIAREKLYKVANLLKSEFFVTSQHIVNQCDIGDKFYIIRAGKIIQITLD